MSASTPGQLETILLDGFNSLSDRRYTRADYDLSFSELGVDSLGMNQVLLHIEENLSGELSDDALEKLAESKNLGDLLRILIDAYSEA